jgi:ribosomal protein L37E
MKEINEVKMICAYCNSEFTPEMEMDYYVISEGCDTCGYGRKVSKTVEITCSSCGRVVYKKEYTDS